MIYLDNTTIGLLKTGELKESSKASVSQLEVLSFISSISFEPLTLTVATKCF